MSTRRIRDRSYKRREVLHPLDVLARQPNGSRSCSDELKGLRNRRLLRGGGRRDGRLRGGGRHGNRRMRVQARVEPCREPCRQTERKSDASLDGAAADELNFAR